MMKSSGAKVRTFVALTTVVMVVACEPRLEDRLRESLGDEAKLALEIQALNRKHPQSKIFLDRALADAVERKLNSAITQMLAAGADPLGFGGSKYSALTKAVCQGDNALVKLFLKSTKQLDDKTTDEMAAEAFECKRENFVFLLPDGKRHHANITLVHACR